MSPRNYEKEAYEKCCSIWAQGYLAGGMSVTDCINFVNAGSFHKLFMAIKGEALKQFPEENSNSTDASIY